MCLYCLQGPAVGAGFCLAMCSDIRIAAKDAKLAANFVKLGLHPGERLRRELVAIARSMR
jgi:enoyl-CoA hydratase/carnithine racemase